MTAPPRAWVLNLDAELELEAGLRYTATDEMKARVSTHARSVAALLDEDDVVIAPSIDASAAGATQRALRGFAWCPTPRALEALRRARVVVPDAPPLEVLRRVHERGFAFALSEGELPCALRATDVETIATHVAERGPTGEWLMKRGFGVAGRGQRPVRAGVLSEPDRAWVLASLRRGALYVEPRVEIARELAVHSWAGARAEVLSIREQRVHGDRSWRSSDRARDLEPALERALVDAAERTGAALIAAGYRGPFGIDAYLWRAPGGALALRTISEINPRYCMGWDSRDGWER